MLCIACGEATDTAPCTSCGDEPRLDGRWALQVVLGQGANGTTYKAVDADGHTVAAKESTLKTSDPAKLRELVEREARVLRQLQHDGIPGYVEELWHQHGRTRSLFLLQEYVEGVDLQRRLDDHRFDEDEVLDVLDELAGILGYLHTRQPPIVHRDVKPSNVMRRPDGRHVLLDFGSVRDVLKDAQLGGSTVAGTFGFMAPEQFAGDASPKSDLYGLGALAVALLTRKDPAKLQRHDRSIDWRDHAAVSPGLAALIDDLLSLDPRSRPASAADVATRIQAVSAGTAPEPSSRIATALASSVKRPEELPPVVLAERLAPDEPEAFHQPPVPHQQASPAAGAALVGGTVLGGVAATVVLLLVLLVSAVLGAGVFLAADVPPEVRVVERTVDVPATPARAERVDFAPSPWPMLTANELASLPLSPSCQVTVHPDATATTDCPAPLAAQAEDWLKLHMPNVSSPVTTTLGFQPRPEERYLLPATSEAVWEQTTLSYGRPTGPVEHFLDLPPEFEEQTVVRTVCRATARLGLDGRADRATIEDCPEPFHGAAQEWVSATDFGVTEPATAIVDLVFKAQVAEGTVTTRYYPESP